MRYIGDVHGKFDEYLLIASAVPESIQVGDFGIGFGDAPPELGPQHRFIRGNHDSPGECANLSTWIPDGTIENDMMLIGGALSIDVAMRKEGVSWWRDEELSIRELDLLVQQYLDLKPRVMVTHECPEAVTNQLFSWYRDEIYPSRTRQALSSMWEQHKPELWIFGHWHASRMAIILGTKFVCLGELNYIDVTAPVS